MQESDPFSSVTIRTFQPGDETAFARLNRQWLEAYFRVEPIDETLFANPQGMILDTGGMIFIAEENGKALGTGALILRETGDGTVYELSKMGVDPAQQGKGIGRKIIEAALQWAKKRGATRLLIYSNTRLAAAIGLYQKMGFSEIPLPEEARARYERCDIMLELAL